MVRRGVRSLAAPGSANRQSSVHVQTQAGDLLGLADGAQQDQQHTMNSGNNSADPGHPENDMVNNDPWRDARPGIPRRTHTAPSTVHHRLSFDYGSGVIVLPEDEDWLEADEDVDSEEEHYGARIATDSISRNLSSGSVPSSTRRPPDNLQSEAIDVHPSSGSESQDSSTLPLKSRYGTYYHHPERRRQTIPGAFPRVAS